MILKKYTEKEIDKIMTYFARKRETTFWGQEYTIEPEIIENIHGDGLQCVYLTPIDTRPNYYVLRIDSSIDIEDDFVNEIDICEMMLQMIEEEHDNIDDYEEIHTGNETSYRYEDEKPKTWDEVYFPTLHWSGGSWGVMCDVSHILN